MNFPHPFDNLGGQVSPKDKRDFTTKKLAKYAAAAEVVPESYFADLSAVPVLYQGKQPACFLAGTKVQLGNGEFKNIEDIKIGDEILDKNGHKQVVRETMSRDWQGRLYRIYPFGINLPLGTTPEHPILTKDGFKNAEELTNKDYVLIPINEEIKDKTDFYFEKDEDFLKVLGLYLAEGYAESDLTRKRYRTVFCLSSKEQHIADFIGKTIFRIFKLNPNISINKNKLEVSFYGKALAETFTKLGGKGAANKKLHSKFLLLQPELQRKIMDGWLLGDGYFKKRNTIIGVTISESLVFQMFHICLRNKIIPSIEMRRGYLKDGVNHQQSYRFSICKSEEKDRKQDWWRGQFIGNYLIRRIRKVEKIKSQWGKSYTVYNLETTNSHTYTANFVAVHNCVGHTIAGAMMFEDGGAESYDYSPRFIYALSKSMDGIPLIEGTPARVALKVGQKVGVCDNAQFPNDITLKKFDYDNSALIPVNAYEVAKDRKIKSYVLQTDRSFSGLKRAIYENGVIILGVELDEAWWSDRNGNTSWAKNDILPLRPPKYILSRHLIYAYGFDKDYIYIRNSFSERWGDKGNGWFGKDYIPHIYEAWFITTLAPEVVAELKRKIGILQKILELLQKLKVVMGK